MDETKAAGKTWNGFLFSAILRRRRVQMTGGYDYREQEECGELSWEEPVKRPGTRLNPLRSKDRVQENNQRGTTEREQRQISMALNGAQTGNGFELGSEHGQDKEAAGQ